MQQVHKVDLREAIHRGDVVKVKKLIDNPKSGARKSINMFENGGTTLHLAIGTKQEIIISILLDSGADPNLPDSYGYAPIHLAILAAEQLARKRRKLKFIQLSNELIEQKKGYSSSLSSPLKNNNSSLKQQNSLLGSLDLDTSTSSFSKMSKTSSLKKISKKKSTKSMIERGVGGGEDEEEDELVLLEKKLEKEKEPLEMGDFGLLTLLLSAGAHVDKSRVIPSTGEVVASPLFEAVYLGEAELVRCLLEYGADPNKCGRARDRAYAEPPLHVAARRACKEQVEVCKLLLKFGAEPSAVAGGLGDDGEMHDLFDATEECSTNWIRSLITGMQMARRNEISDKISKKKAKALAKAKVIAKMKDTNNSSRNS